MYRKLSVPGRRSSLLTRLSAPNEIQDEKNGRRPSDGKKSLIPRPTQVSLRSSSAEIYVGSTHKPRSASVESNVDRDPKSAVRVRSTENLTTPKNAVNSPVVGSRLSRATSTCKKSVRRDTRPLSDRAFQRYELSKVHEYLIDEDIIQRQQIREVQCPMTLKMFVHIMNSLLQKLSPSVNVNVGNYAEVIPNFMKKLKYPGTINRSSLVTANSPHSWPHVLGIISWLTHLLSSECTLEYVQDDDVLEIDKVKKLLSNTSERYLEWEESGVVWGPEEEEKFFHDLLQDKNEALDEETLYVQKKIESLQSLESGINSPEEIASQEKLKSSLTVLTTMKAEINQMKVSLQNLTLGVKKGADELLTLQRDIANQKSMSVSMVNKSEQKYSDTRQITDEDIAKLQSEVVSLGNVVKYQKTHLEDITSHCYNDDLTSARQRSLLDQMVLKREAVLRNCTSESLDTNKMQIKLSTRDADYVNGMKNYIAYLQEIINEMKQNIIEHSKKEKEHINKINHTAENIKCLNEILSKMEAEMIRIIKDTEQKEKKISDLESEMCGELNEMQERNLKLQQEIEEQDVLIPQVEKEYNLSERAYQNNYDKYKSILDQCNEELQKQVEKCTELVKRTFLKN